MIEFAQREIQIFSKGNSDSIEKKRKKARK